MSWKAVFIDLSGTLHVGDKVISGSVEALERLRKSNLKIRFVTNTTKESLSMVFHRLTSLGFKIGKHEIFSSSIATIELLKKRGVRPLLIVDDKALEDFEGIETTDPNAVVIGLAPDKFHYNNLNVAFKLIKEKKAPLIAIHRGRYYQTEDGLSLGPGPFVSALEYATNVKSEIVGKPSSYFFQSAIDDVGCSAEEVVMIGDDIQDDIKGAQDICMTGILVRTGKYRPGAENTIPNFKPNHIVDNFASAVSEILLKDRN